MADWNGQIDIVGWFKKVFNKMLGPWMILLTAFGETKLLRKNLSVITDNLPIFTHWWEFRSRHDRLRGESLWVRLGALVFKIEDDKSKLRKILLGGTKAIPCLFVLSPPDAEVEIKTGSHYSDEQGFFLKDKDSKMTRIDLKADDTWWAILSEETSKAVSSIGEIKAEKAAEKELLLQEARDLMNFNSDNRKTLLKMWCGKRSFKG